MGARRKHIPEVDVVSLGVAAVDDGDEAVELDEGVLERGWPEEELPAAGGGIADAVGCDAGRRVDVTEALGLIDGDEVPGYASDVLAVARGQIVGGNNDALAAGVERVGAFDRLNGRPVDDGAGEPELLDKFRLPPLAERGEDDEEDAAAGRN